jgi:hypothetical protein
MPAVVIPTTIRASIELGWFRMSTLSQATSRIAGLLAIRNAGGTTIAQEPEEAQNPEMPIAALEARAVDYCLPIKDIAAKLSELSD